MARIDGTPMADVLSGDTSGFPENDEIYGYAHNDWLDGLGGDDQLYGHEGDDTLLGYDGDDTLDGGADDDYLNGEDGSDTASYSTATAGVTVSLIDGFGQASGGAGLDTLESIENLTGSKFSDTFISDGSTNSTFKGGRGDDYIEVNHSVGDRLNGEAGNDTLIVGNGFSTLNGGTGHDHLMAHDGGVLNGGNGNDVLEVAGSVFDDSTLNGGAGDDTLTSADGSDVLTGGTGQDELTGQTGADRFDYNAVSDSPAGAGRDVISDFAGSLSEGDTIDLSDIDANALLTGDQAFTLGQLDYVGGIFSADIIGTGPAPDIEIALVGAPPLFLADVVL